MALAQQTATDLVDELRLRRWARENYVLPEARDAGWPALVLEEMRRKDDEVAETGLHLPTGARAVPLMPAHDFHLHGPHVELPPTILLRVPAVNVPFLETSGGQRSAGP